jgi:hypothetical protein
MLGAQGKKSCSLFIMTIIYAGKAHTFQQAMKLNQMIASQSGTHFPVYRVSIAPPKVRPAR